MNLTRWAALALALLAPPAPAADFPQRKSGLWELQVEGARGGAGAMKMCIDQASDNTLKSIGGQGAENCAKNEVRSDGANRFVTQSVCKVHGSTATSNGVFTGDFATAYHFEVKTAYAPPLLGQANAITRGQARWTGACPAGLKPGQMLLPGGAKVDMNRR